MVIGVLKETAGETRVSLLPETVAALIKKGMQVVVETGAGTLAFATDADYLEAGASLLPRAEVIQSAELLLSMHAPADAEIAALSGKLLIGVYQPLFHARRMERWASGG